MFFTASAVPVFVGTAAAFRLESSFSPGLFAVTLAAVLLYHAGLNVLNDYFDAKSGADAANADPLTPFAGGSRMIQSGLVSMRETLLLAIGLLALGTLAGVYLACSVGPGLLVIGAAGLAIGVAYSSPPFSLSYRGLGEIAVGLEFGVLSVIGSYFVQTGEFKHPLELAFASLPISLLITALLYINEFADYEADLKAGKKNLVVRLGIKRARHGFLLLVLIAYSIILLGALGRALPRPALMALLPGALAAGSVNGLYAHSGSKRGLVRPIKLIILAHLITGILLAASCLTGQRP